MSDTRKPDTATMRNLASVHRQLAQMYALDMSAGGQTTRKGSLATAEALEIAADFCDAAEGGPSLDPATLDPLTAFDHAAQMVEGLLRRCGIYVKTGEGKWAVKAEEGSNPGDVNRVVEYGRRVLYLRDVIRHLKKEAQQPSAAVVG